MPSPRSLADGSRAYVRAARYVTAMKKLFLAPLAMLIMAPVVAQAGGRSPSHHAKLSMAKARAIALAKIPGTVRSQELEHEHGRWIYSFEIKPTGEVRRIVREVNLDADTGAVVSLEIEHDSER